MFLIMGICSGEKKLHFDQTVVCPCCGRYGHYEVYMKYMCFSLFFIPVIKWNKKFYIKTTCCECYCEIEDEIGYKIAQGEVTELNQNDLHFISVHSALKQCNFCGYTTDENFQYCPKCGKAF